MSGAARGWHPRSRSLVVDGVQTHYVREGAADRPTLLLVHGFLVSSWSWRSTLEGLSADFDVVAPCLKGFGWSERVGGDYSLDGLGRFVLRLMDALQIERAHLCGNSLGGAISLWLAANAPSRVERLVLVNGLAVRSSLPQVPKLLSGPWMAPLYRPFVRPTLARVGLQALAYRGLRVDSSYMQGFRPPFEHSRSVPIALDVARGLTQAVAEVDASLEQLRHPTLVVQGMGDRLLSPRAGFEIARRVPQARLVSFHGSGHCPHEEEPERFNAVLRAFLAEGG